MPENIKFRAQSTRRNTKDNFKLFRSLRLKLLIHKKIAYHNQVIDIVIVITILTTITDR